MRTTVLTAAVAALAAIAANAHDLERTQVTIAIDRSGSFVVDVVNDPAWLLLRLEPFAGGIVPVGLTADHRDRRLQELSSVLVDRVVLYVDRHEVRPQSAEYVPQIGGFRLRGRLPAGARTLRWLYGLVIDPYPLTIRFADGRSMTRVVAGDAWSEPIALPQTASAAERALELSGLVIVAGVLLGLRILRAERSHSRSDR